MSISGLPVYAWILLIAAVAIGFVLVKAALLPDTFRITRSTTIHARPEQIFPRIDDLRAFNTWNPFARSIAVDEITYSGSVAGKGAAFEWDSKGQGGAGRIEVVESQPSSLVRMSLEFRRPFAARNVAEFSLRGAGEATEITWAMTGPWPLLHRVMNVFFDSDKMVGGEFEKGLAELKRMSEAS